MTGSSAIPYANRVSGQDVAPLLHRWLDEPALPDLPPIPQR